jgi:hypothetical protein
VGVACCCPGASHRRDGVAGVCAAAVVRLVEPCVVAAALVSALVLELSSRAHSLRPEVVPVVNGAKPNSVRAVRTTRAVCAPPHRPPFGIVCHTGRAVASLGGQL